ncbi:MAG: hypothetical protein ACRD82_12630, partial [Blastocatellia bacterium]
MKTLALIVLLIASTTVFAQTPKKTSEHVDPAVEAAAMKVLGEYMDAWNKKDLDDWERTFHFPHYRLASGKMSVLEKPGQQDATRIWQAIPGWHHSKWD